jgi:hypothetical protein
VQTVAALKSPPRRLTPPAEGADPVFFPRLVQPVLDRKCVGCHASKEEAPDLGTEVIDVELKRSRQGQGRWTQSYSNLAPFGFAFSGMTRCLQREGSRTVPGQFGARASKLHNMLQDGHHDVKLTTEEMQRITLWLDSNSVFYGAYHQPDKQLAGETVIPLLE